MPHLPTLSLQKGKFMVKRKNWTVLLLIGIFLISGCVPLAVVGAGAGAGTGTYFFINGEMKTDYYYSFDAVWSACEKTIADMRGVDVQPAKEIGNGKISALIDEEKVQIAVTYKDKNVTTVSIRVGLIGNERASRLIHDKIADNLVRK
jgi:hypothetical protein